MDVQIDRGYWMLKWFASEFASELETEAKTKKVAVEEVLDQWLNDVPVGSDGLILQPYWGPGLARPLAKGAIIGFSSVHTRKHIYRAIVEGIAFALREGLESIEKSQKHKVKSLRISGGGSLSEEICQITADIFGLEIARVQTIESTSLGAAIATFTAIGEFPTIHDAVNSMTKISNVFKPNMENHKRYNQIYR
jgi:sugar (pentulose or hexulose) kinase